MNDQTEIQRQATSLIDDVSSVNTAIMNGVQLVSSDLLQFISDRPDANALQTVAYPAEAYVEACKAIVSAHVDLVVRLKEFTDSLSANAPSMTTDDVYDALHCSPSTPLFLYIYDDLNANAYHELVTAIEFVVPRHESDQEISDCLAAYQRWLHHRAYGSDSRRDVPESLDYGLNELIRSIVA